jgi:hypothetical protein
LINFSSTTHLNRISIRRYRAKHYYSPGKLTEAYEIFHKYNMKKAYCNALDEIDKIEDNVNLLQNKIKITLFLATE